MDNIELGNAYDAGAANLITEQHESNYSVNGENNPNFKTGFFAGRLDDPLIYKKTDKVRNAIRHKKNLNRGRSRMKARYYLSVNNIQKAKYWFDEWIKAIESQPESTKGKFKKKMPVWSVWKNSQNFERK